MTAAVFDTGLQGRRCWLEAADGHRVELPVERWRDDPRGADELMLDRCTGPTLDLGCGPGRLTAALTARGISALGVDVSAVAVAQTKARGAVAVRQDLFQRLPGEGRWWHVLLADGNVGIGGDPVALLRRVRALLGTHGTVLVEVDRPGLGLRQRTVRVAGEDGSGRWFDWAWLGADALTGVAEEAGLAVRSLDEQGGRWIAELTR
ncbi:class I SAM-dependent methyltransferase [Labedaea rhizosphaerae]|uniref:Methyltransferase family protein n=1 Tax=Labedaea rhizosphaerae TaxID=598644 RepID=A0A4R6SJ58_LABRH|nr:methyltransferase domain-containing protein [Labedaea rhizosphaerae]TDQ04346.1 methyltransferase family protein [Labedaea rhizosphaerae]